MVWSPFRLPFIITFRRKEKQVSASTEVGALVDQMNNYAFLYIAPLHRPFFAIMLWQSEKGNVYISGETIMLS